MSAELKKAFLQNLEEQLLDRTRVSEDTNCPRCRKMMTMTFKTPRTTTFRCEACGHRLSRQTLR
jgi:tRNA(Ile2) C34 agmatinyltransferase TiaS